MAKSIANDKAIKKSADFTFGKRNYQLMIAGLVMLVIGFMLMSGGKPTDPNEFNGEEMFSTTRITIAPIIVLIGFVVEIFAIMHKAKEE